MAEAGNETHAKRRSIQERRLRKYLASCGNWAVGRDYGLDVRSLKERASVRRHGNGILPVRGLRRDLDEYTEQTCLDDHDRLQGALDDLRDDPHSRRLPKPRRRAH